MYPRRPSSRAFVLIATVLSLLAFSLTLAVALAQFSLGTSIAYETVYSSAQALVLAEGCAEGALNEIQADPDYNDGSYITSAGTCDMDLRQDEADATRYTLRVSAIVNNVSRSVFIEVVRTETQLTLVSWSEV